MRNLKTKPQSGYFSNKENRQLMKELHQCQKSTSNIWKENPILKEYEKLKLI